jgi:hypothetical protein
VKTVRNSMVTFQVYLATRRDPKYSYKSLANISRAPRTLVHRFATVGITTAEDIRARPARGLPPFAADAVRAWRRRQHPDRAVDRSPSSSWCKSVRDPSPEARVRP